MRSIIFFLFFSVTGTLTFASNLYIIQDENTKGNTTVQLALNDFKSLLAQYGNTSFTEQYNEADVFLHLQQRPDFIASGNMDSIAEKGGFQWVTITAEAKTHLYLHAATYKGFADGLYALLQERLGFHFYHTRAIQAPANTNIKWENTGSFSGKPVFGKMGFHLHTMHPLELTESLLNVDAPDALKNIREYIDWLARNGQNYFEFNLLESIDRDRWIEHAKQITEYAHQRGIFCGVDLSIHMIQQKAFQLYTGKLKKEEKIAENAAWLLQAGFDLWNVELSTHEFSQGDAEEKMRHAQLLFDILEKNGVKLFSRSHVVKPDKMVTGDKVNNAEAKLSDKHGLMIHTVMFYTLNDSAAPVYENENLLHMRDLLLKEKQQRETWYYPESAYWVTFDNSVPMFLMPYLTGRLEDINYCEQQQISGHLTFSSGWEWGYWLIDWSIARWSWNYTYNSADLPKSPLQYLHGMTDNKDFISFTEQSLQLQQQKIKAEQLIRVMVAQTITDEIGGKFNLAYHPRPAYSYKHIRNKASLAELDFVQKNYLDKLQEFCKSFESLKMDTASLKPVEREIYDGIYITYLRAKHRYQTLQYITHFRSNKLQKNKTNLTAFLQQAAAIRTEGLKIVAQREQNYRYPVASLTYKGKDKTSYHFGYLYPVHQLHFWNREEKQARHNKYKFLYMKIWNIARIVGLIN